MKTIELTSRPATHSLPSSCNLMESPMGQKRGKEAEAVVRAVASELGAAIVEVGFTGGNHKYALIERGGARRKFFFPKTPGDVRGHLNLRTEARKAIGAMA
jgi:hypothetical protein